MNNLRKYGDIDNAKKDVKTIHEILDRQGANLIADCIAESIATTSVKFNLSFNESRKIMDSIIDELRTQTFERL